MAAPTVREVVSASLLYNASTKANTVSTSSAVQVGDLLLVVYALDYGQLDQSQGPTPGGWISQGIATSAGAAPYTRAWTSPVTTAGVQTVSVTQTDQYTDSNLILIVLIGADLAHPLDVAAVNNGSAATAHLANGVTTAAVDELVVWAWGSGIVSGDSGSYAMPAGVTLVRQLTSAPYSTLAVGTSVAATAGATGSKTATFTRGTSPATATSYAALTLAIRPTPPAPANTLTSTLGLATAVTASKAVTVNVRSDLGVGSAVTPAKGVTVNVTSPLAVAALFGQTQDVVSIPPGGPLDVSLWALDDAGNYVGPLPDCRHVTVSPVAGGPGVISLEYPSDGLNFPLLHNIITGNRDLPIAIWLGGRESGSLRGLILEGTGDEVKEQSVWSFTGVFDEFRMSDAVLYPDPTDPDGRGQTVFTAASAGQIMASLMTAARARGALTGISSDTFTAVTDSAGRRFSTVVTLAIAPGVDYLALLGTLTSIGLCEWAVDRSKRLLLFEPGTRGVDRTVGSRPLILHQARDMIDAPRKYSIRTSATAMVGAGAKGLSASASDAAALLRRGRRIERYASQNQITDQGALTAYLQAELGSIGHGRTELTHGISFNGGGPLPVADFGLGDWVFSDNGNGLERLRVQQWSITQDASGIMTGSVTVGDLIDEHDLQVSKRLAALASGTTVIGTSTPPPVPTNDSKAPAVPTGLVCSSLVYSDLGPPVSTAASVFAGWAAVTTNVDGTALGTSVTYRVRYRYLDAPAVSGTPLPEGWAGSNDGLPWLEGGATTTTTVQFSGLSPNKNITVQVASVIKLDPSAQPYEYDSLNRAFRRTERQSLWSAGFDLTTANDVTPPSVPSMPTVTTGPGAIARISWDGRTSDGTDLAAATPDLAYTEVHVSTLSNFAPDTSSFLDRLYGPGTTVASNLLYQIGYFARLVAVDQAGNRSGPSEQAAFTPHELLSRDLFAGCVGSAQLAYAAVKNANIDTLAVNAAQIGSVDVGSLVSGVGTFDMLLAGRIKSAKTGGRYELDGYSWRQYGVDGTTITNQFIAATGEAIITGLIRSGTAGKRWEMNPDGTLRLYPSVGFNYSAIFNNSQSGTNELVLRGQLDASGRSGYLRANSTGIAAQFGVPGQTVTAQLSVGNANIDLTSPINGLRSDQRFATANGQPYNNLLIFNDSAGADIGTSVIQHSLWSTGNTGFGCTGRNANILFSNSDSRGIKLVYNDGNACDLQCGNVYAPNVVAPSGRAVKEQIGDLTFEPLAVIRGARALAWQYKPGLGRTHTPDTPITGVRVRKRKPGTNPSTGHGGDFITVDEPLPTPVVAPPVRRVGPMADDILAIAPDLVTRDGSDLALSYGDQIGVLWAAVAHLADTVDQLVGKFPDIPALPGRRRAAATLTGSTSLTA